jgi:drug/metabolite transporter (DMT)-like permease
MAAILLLIHVFANQGEVMLVRQHGKKHGSGGMFFNGILCLFATLFFLISDTDGLDFVSGLWRYGMINALLYGAGFYLAYVAYKLGSFLLVNTVTSLSFLLPIFYGLFFLREPVNHIKCLALICTFASFFLMVYRKNPAKEKAEKVSFQWLLPALLSLCSTGFINILNKMQQAQFQGQYRNEYMIITLAGASLFLLILGLFTERQDFRKTLFQGGFYGMAAGLLNGIASAANLAAMMLIPLSVLTAVKMALGKLFSFVISFFLYKERYSVLQYLSIVFGVLSLVLMQIS